MVPADGLHIEEALECREERVLARLLLRIVLDPRRQNCGAVEALGVLDEAEHVVQLVAEAALADAADHVPLLIPRAAGGAQTPSRSSFWGGGLS